MLVNWFVNSFFFGLAIDMWDEVKQNEYAYFVTSWQSGNFNMFLRVSSSFYNSNLGKFIRFYVKVIAFALSMWMLTFFYPQHRKWGVSKIKKTGKKCLISFFSLAFWDWIRYYWWANYVGLMFLNLKIILKWFKRKSSSHH